MEDHVFIPVQAPHTPVKNQKKKIIAIIAMILVLCLAAYGILLVTVESRVVDRVWGGGPVYLSSYSSNCYRLTSIDSNGEYLSVLMDSDTNILDLDAGSWEIEGFTIYAKMPGEAGRVTLHFNPITGKLTSGSWVLSPVEE